MWGVRVNAYVKRLVVILALAFGIGALSAWASLPNAPTFKIRTDSAQTQSVHINLMSDVSYSAPKAGGGGGTGGSGGAAPGCNFRCKALKWALTQAGKPYEWGGTGPNGYDCSGLVYKAYKRLGHYFGRTTYQMLDDGGLYRVKHPQAGDLDFFGSGHVEFWDGDRESYGAHHSGTDLSKAPWSYRSGWYPSGFYRVRLKTK
jgi:hypothetical protein